MTKSICISNPDLSGKTPWTMNNEIRIRFVSVTEFVHGQTMFFVVDFLRSTKTFSVEDNGWNSWNLKQRSLEGLPGIWTMSQHPIKSCNFSNCYWDFHALTLPMCDEWSCFHNSTFTFWSNVWDNVLHRLCWTSIKFLLLKLNTETFFTLTEPYSIQWKARSYHAKPSRTEPSNMSI